MSGALRALTRAVSPTIARCELTHLARTPIDPARAEAEHRAYEAALCRLGVTVERLPSAPELPDAVFVEDTAVVLDQVAVITRPGAASRRAETASVAAALEGHRPLVRIEAPGTLDGGDVIVAGRRLYVGRSSRSNSAGLAQLARLLADFDYTVHPVEFQGCLHLKSAASLPGDGLLLHNPAWVQAGAFSGTRPLPVDPAEPHAGNALAVGGRVIYPAHHPRTAERLAHAGLELEPVPLAELARAEAGVTCCSLLIRS